MIVELYVISFNIQKIHDKIRDYVFRDLYHNQDSTSIIFEKA